MNDGPIGVPNSLVRLVPDLVKMFYNKKSDEYRRVNALRDLDLHEGARSPECSALVSLAATYLDMPIGIISLLDRDNQIFFASHGMSLAGSSRADAICNIVLAANSAQVITDTQADARTRENRFVTRAPFVRFYAGYPIRSYDGHVVGTFCLMDDKVRTLTDDEDRAFRQFGAIAEAVVTAHAQGLALKRSQADLLASTQQLTRANSAMAQAGRIAKIGRWEINIRTMSVTWSDEVYRIHELDLIEGKSVVLAVNYYADYDQKRVNGAVRDAIVDGTPFDFTADLITAKGSVRRVRSAGERDASGSAGARIIGIIQDVTDVVSVSAIVAGVAEQRSKPESPDVLIQSQKQS